MKNLARLDFYPKTVEDFRVRTTLGGILSIFTTILLVSLLLWEVILFISFTEVHSELSVDTERDTKEKLPINIDITFHRMACDFLTLDVMDTSGEEVLDVHEATMFEQKLDRLGNKLDDPSASRVNEGFDETRTGDEVEKKPTEVPANYCGSCYGATTETGCCNNCEEVREAYRTMGWAFSNAETIEQCEREGFVDNIKNQEGHGCRFYGSFKVNKVAGNFHFAPGKSFKQNRMHIHDLQPFRGIDFNISHSINHLYFGNVETIGKNPLDLLEKRDLSSGGAMFQYFLKIIPTVNVSLAGLTVDSYQYSVTTYEREIVRAMGRGLPGVFFMYDVSPIKMEFRQRKEHFAHLLTNIVAIIGSIYTAFMILEMVLQAGIHSIKGKQGIGKFQ